jgi:hypothetical protein
MESHSGDRVAFLYFALMLSGSNLLKFSSFGLIAGLLNVLGWLGGLEWLYWIAAILFTGIWISRNTEERFFINGLLIGLMWSIWNAALEIGFYDALLANNPAYSESLSEISKYLNPKLYLLLLSPVMGIITGLMIFLAASLFRKSKK